MHSTTRRLLISIALLLTTTSIAGAATVSLAWDPSSSAEVVGYRLDYGVATGVYTTSVDVGNRTSWSLVLPDGGVFYVVVRGYDASGAVTPPSNELIVTTVAVHPPAVQITSPHDGDTITAPATIAATASDIDGTVRDVTFYVNGAALETDTTSPYSVTWSGAAPGTYTI